MDEHLNFAHVLEKELRKHWKIANFDLSHLMQQLITQQIAKLNENRSAAVIVVLRDMHSGG